MSVKIVRLIRKPVYPNCMLGRRIYLWINKQYIKWKHFPRYWPFVREIHRSPVNSPHKGQRREHWMFSLTCALNKRLSKQSWVWWFEMPTHSLWRHRNDNWPNSTVTTGFPSQISSNAELSCFLFAFTYKLLHKPSSYCWLHTPHVALIWRHCNEKFLRHWNLNRSKFFIKSPQRLKLTLLLRWWNTSNHILFRYLQSYGSSVSYIYTYIWTEMNISESMYVNCDICYDCYICYNC